MTCVLSSNYAPSFLRRPTKKRKDVRKIKHSVIICIFEYFLWSNNRFFSQEFILFFDITRKSKKFENREKFCWVMVVFILKLEISFFFLLGKNCGLVVAFQLEGLSGMMWEFFLLCEDFFYESESSFDLWLPYLDVGIVRNL
jgi:hypothetical protein